MCTENTMAQRQVNLQNIQNQCHTTCIHQQVVCINNTSNMEDVDNQTTHKINEEEQDCDNNEEEKDSNLVTPTPTPAHCPPTNIVTKQSYSKERHVSHSSKNTESMASVLAEIRREADEDTPEN